MLRGTNAGKLQQATLEHLELAHHCLVDSFIPGYQILKVTTTIKDP